MITLSVLAKTIIMNESGGWVGKGLVYDYYLGAYIMNRLS